MEEARILAGNIHPPCWSPVIPAVHQGQRSSELQTALQGALSLSCSFYISISFGCGQESVSGALMSGSCVKKQALYREQGNAGGDFALVTQLGQNRREEREARVCSQMGKQDSHWKTPSKLLERAGSREGLSLLQNL